MDKIDFIVSWVDGTDKIWRNEKKKYLADGVCDVDESRYRTLGTLKYWFRAVEEYAPWVNHVYFITWGHVPPWLNVNCKKLSVVNHKDYIPEKYLPTFSSHPIELNLHRIQGLSEYFVYFNDDMLINAKIEPEFFFKKGLPCDFAYINNIYFDGSDDVYAHIQVNEVWEISKHFSYIKSFCKKPTKYLNLKYPLKNNIKNIVKLENKQFFTGIENHHLASPYLKETLVKSWEESRELLDRVSKNKFRTPFDVSQSIFRYRQIAEGNFYPVSKQSRGKSFTIAQDNENLIEAIFSKQYKLICINDTPKKIDFDRAKEQILSAYEKKLPQRCQFER